MAKDMLATSSGVVGFVGSTLGFDICMWDIKCMANLQVTNQTQLLDVFFSVPMAPVRMNGEEVQSLT